MFKFSTKKIARAGVISALYVLLSVVVLPVASGVIQFRPSEALTLLPIFYLEAVPALFIGCLLANIITGCALLDVFFGSLITLVASVLTFLIARILKNNLAKFLIGGIFPVLLNAFLLPLIWLYCYGSLEYIYFVQTAFLLVSQSLSVYLLGLPLTIGVNKMIKKGYVGFIE